MEQNIMQGITPEDTAKKENYSLKQLNRIFSLATGLTISEYIRWSRLTKSLFELRYSEDSIVDIALKHGYDTKKGLRGRLECIFQ